jgi:hypothetical protein
VTRSEARRAYERRYRAERPELRQREALATTARRVALQELARRHPDEFLALYNDARILRGLTEVGSKPGPRPRSEREVAQS